MIKNRLDIESMIRLCVYIHLGFEISWKVFSEFFDAIVSDIYMDDG
jgi:hypothetical protein